MEPMREWTEAELEALQKRFAKEYRQAYGELRQKHKKFMADYERERSQRLKALDDTKEAKAEFDEWLRLQTLQAKWLDGMVRTYAQTTTKANQAAVAAISGRLPLIFSENANYAAYGLSKDAKMNIPFTLVNEDAVARILRDNPKLYPEPKVDVPKDMLWNRQKYASAITQGILQGESEEDIAKRLQRVVGMNEGAAKGAARLSVGGAMNAGTLESLKRAQEMGIECVKEWDATLDNRTRHSHRALDGEKVELDEAFSNGLQYPGDPDGGASEVYGCRCVLTGWPVDVDDSDRERWDRFPKGMTYEEWKEGRPVIIDGMKQNEPLVKLGTGDNAFAVSPVVNTKAYHDAFDDIPLPVQVRESTYVQAGRILSFTNGTENEHMVAVDARTGKVVADNLGRTPAKRRTGFNEEEMAAITAHGKPIVTIHNHPASYQPSFQDMLTAARNGQVAASIVIGHDGSVWYISISNPSIADELEKGYNMIKDRFGDLAEVRTVEQVLKRNGKKQGLDWRRLR